MGSSPVRVTSKKDRQHAYPFLLPRTDTTHPLGCGKMRAFIRECFSLVHSTKPPYMSNIYIKIENWARIVIFNVL